MGKCVSAPFVAAAKAPRGAAGSASSRPLTTVDLFCGCGGMSLGFQAAGFQVAAAFDHWGPAIDVYRANFHHPVYQRDLGDPSVIEEIVGWSPEVIIGGPPCQDFSSAGPNRPASARSHLMGRFIDVVEAAKPDFVVMENVPRSRLQPVFKRAEARLLNAGYGLTLRVLDACRCGVPQLRERMFLIAAKGAAPDFLGPALDSGLAAHPMTLRDYFGNSLGTDYYFRVPTNYSRRGVFSIDAPSMTIRGVDRPIPSGYPGHPDDPVPIGPKVRAFTVLERSYIQTFPRDFKFEGTKSNLNTMIGNAVPVKLAEYVARALLGFARRPNGNSQA